MSDTREVEIEVNSGPRRLHLSYATSSILVPKDALTNRLFAHRGKFTADGVEIWEPIEEGASDKP
jgi:hypothetical protein